MGSLPMGRSRQRSHTNSNFLILTESPVGTPIAVKTHQTLTGERTNPTSRDYIDMFLCSNPHGFDSPCIFLFLLGQGHTTVTLPETFNPSSLRIVIGDQASAQPFCCISGGSAAKQLDTFTVTFRASSVGMGPVPSINHADSSLMLQTATVLWRGLALHSFRLFFFTVPDRNPFSG